MSTFDKIPPHDADAEAALLGSVMLDREMWAECAGLVGGESFYEPINGLVWRVVSAMYQAKTAVDALTLRAELHRQNLLEEVGGVQAIARMLTTVPSAAHGMHYAAIVAEKHKLREIIRAASVALRAAYDQKPADAVALDLERSGAAVRETGQVDTIRHIADFGSEVLEAKRSKRTERIRCGLVALDDITGGFPLSGTTMVAAKPGMGKSQLCKQIAMNIAGGLVGQQDAFPVGIIAIEEGGHKIATNLMSNVGGIENSRIVHNLLNGEEMERLSIAQDELKAFPIFIDDAQLRLSDITRVARRLVKKHGCRVIIVDHIHLIDAEFDANREQQLSAISGGLKSLWKELKVAGIEALQMNRGGEREALPELDNLRGSGSLEADGDVIIQLHRQDYYEWKKHGQNFTPDHTLMAFVNKNKDGGPGKADLHFDGDHQRITDKRDSFGD